MIIRAKTKEITPTNHSRSRQCNEPITITCNSLVAREKSCVHGVVGFGFDSHRVKNWCESFEPITKHSNRNHVITFDSHFKTALDMTVIVNQWESKPKPFAPRTCDFSRASSELQVIAGDCDWFMVLFIPVVIAWSE